MSTELMEAPANGREVQHRPPNVLDLIRVAVTSPEVDVAKLQAMLDMQIQLETRAAKIEYDAAMARVQEKMPRVTKSRVIPGREANSKRSAFAPIEDIDLVVRPLLAEEGFSVKWNSEVNGDRLRVIGTIAHRLGHSETASFDVRYSTPPGASNAQGDGSTLSYGKRQLLKMMLNIIEVDADDDGRGDMDAPISADEVAELSDAIKRTNSVLAKFLEHFGVCDLAELKRGELKRARDMLDRKARR